MYTLYSTVRILAYCLRSSGEFVTLCNSSIKAARKVPGPFTYSRVAAISEATVTVRIPATVANK